MPKHMNGQSWAHNPEPKYLAETSKAASAQRGLWALLPPKQTGSAPPEQIEVLQVKGVRGEQLHQMCYSSSSMVSKIISTAIKTKILLKQDKSMQELKTITEPHSHHSYKRQANTARVKIPQQQCHNVPKHNKQKTENNPRPQWLNQNNPLAYTARVKVMHNMPKLQWKGCTVKEQWLALWPQI